MARRLAIGDIKSCLPFIRILPVSLSASLVADSYLAPKFTEIDRLAQTDPGAAADAHVRMEASIRREVIHSRRVTARLVECLDGLKARNPMLRGLRRTPSRRQSSIYSSPPPAGERRASRERRSMEKPFS
jgi:hypothetical protein